MTTKLLHIRRRVQLGALCAISVLSLSLVRAEAQTQAPAAGSVQPQAIIIIRGGWLFDGVRDTRVRNTGIVVRGGKFMEVGADLAGRNLSNGRFIELDDNTTILPGFFDLHGHYNIDVLGEGRVEEAAYNAMIQLANGVTSSWPAGEFFPEKVLEAKAEIDSGKRPGTRIFPSGPYFGAFRCEYKIKAAEDDCPAWPNTITEAQIRADLNYWVDRGVRSIKIKQATPDEMRILVDQAHKRGITTTSHLGNYAGGWDVLPKEAIALGLDRIEHWLTPNSLSLGSRGGGGPDAKDPDLPEMIALLLKHRVYFDPNMQMFGGTALRDVPDLRPKMLWVDEAKFYTPYARMRIEQFEAERIRSGGRVRTIETSGFRRRMTDLKAIYDAGGGHLLILGTDLPAGKCCGALVPGFAYHREMQAWAYSGLPLVAILKAATINGARALAVGDQLGSIEVGKIADLVIVSGNPLQDITAARDVRMVMKDGQLYDPKALLDAAVNRIGPAGPGENPAWTMYDKIRPLAARPASP